MAQLMWAKLHLMTEDGRDAGTGTLNTAIRSEWQDSHGTVSSRFTVPDTLPAGKYVLHVYGSTLQPCEGSTDSALRCEGVLSETLPVEITSTGSRTDTSLLTSSTVVHLPLRKRTLFAGRGLLGPHSRGASPDAQLLDGRMDTKKMLYFFSLI
ncbi:hypothetical protein BGZ99_005127 [Dissophora globulifera]|uniref:Uncharacterized protein n=1 Tax=Dissophora globulifera TaxID=979702 RepID=A0A9P6RK82_9FUNG|nr:hypothetical protein BGZ99_005127 [Dissophora globulifera]